MLTQPAKLLLSKHPELIGEIINSHLDFITKNCEDGTFAGWSDFVKANQPNNSSNNCMETKIKTKSGEFIFSDEKVAISFGASEHHVITVAELKKLLNTCPHCGVPTDGTGNEQCWKAPKEWEIVSRYTDGEIWVDTSTNERIHGGIKSVKRMSDGEIISIGDTHEYPTGVTEKIIELKECNGGLFFKTGNISNHIRLFKRGRKLLFTTYDNVQVYTGDRIFGVLPKANWQTNFRNGEGVPANKLSNYTNTVWLWFSNQKSASEYILLNKPCLSVKDVEDLFCFGCSKEYNTRQAKAIAKQKLSTSC